MTTRREFLGKSGAGVAGAVLGSTAASYARILGANDRVRVGLVGFAVRTRADLLPAFWPHAKELNFDITAVSDIWRLRREEGAAEVAKLVGHPVAQARNNDELYDRKDVDAVIIATADFQHAQHAIEAVKAGRDAYVEKPLANTMEDARAVLAAVKGSDRVVQIGTQRRSGTNYQRANDFIRSGKFGAVNMVEMSWNVNQPGRWRRPALVAQLRQEDTDWGRYLINRPKAPWDPRRYLEYRLFWPYSSGIPDQWMVHQIDTVHWFSGLPHPRSVAANGGIYQWNDGRTNFDTMTAVFDYGPRGRQGRVPGRVLVPHGERGGRDQGDLLLQRRLPGPGQEHGQPGGRAPEALRRRDGDGGEPAPRAHAGGRSRGHRGHHGQRRHDQRARAQLDGVRAQPQAAERGHRRRLPAFGRALHDDRRAPHRQARHLRRPEAGGRRRVTLGFAVVGAGVAARYHAQAIAQSRGARLAAVCRADPARARDAEAEFGVPCETRYDALLARKDVDAVCLCTPSGDHAAQAVAAARAGKHVLVEKPMALTLPDADRMIDAARQAGVRLGVAFQRRTEPSYVEVRRAALAGELGRPVLGAVTVPYLRPQAYYDSAAWRGTWEHDGGGALMNQGIHLVDLLLWLLGDVDEVEARMTTASHRIEVEDCVGATLRFASGALGSITATTSAAPGFPHRVEVYGTRGGVQIEGDAITRWETERQGRRRTAGDRRARDGGGGLRRQRHRHVRYRAREAARRLRRRDPGRPAAARARTGGAEVAGAGAGHLRGGAHRTCRAPGAGGARVSLRLALVAASAWVVALGAPASAADQPLAIGYCTDDPQKAKDLGFEYAELPVRNFTALSEEDFATFAEKVRATGLPTPVGNVFFPADLRLVGPEADQEKGLAWARTALARAKALGLEIVVFGSGGARRAPEGFPADQAFQQLVAFAKRLGPEAEKHGIVVAVEPLRREETNTINSVAEGLRWVEAVGHPNFQLMSDFYHLASEKEDPVILRRAKHAHPSRAHRQSHRARVPDGERRGGLRRLFPRAPGHRVPRAGERGSTHDRCPRGRAARDRVPPRRHLGTRAGEAGAVT